MKKEFDVIVIGGGHAGCEAVAAAAVVAVVAVATPALNRWLLKAGTLLRRPGRGHMFAASPPGRPTSPGKCRRR